MLLKLKKMKLSSTFFLLNQLLQTKPKLKKIYKLLKLNLRDKTWSEKENNLKLTTNSTNYPLQDQPMLLISILPLTNQSPNLAATKFASVIALKLLLLLPPKLSALILAFATKTMLFQLLLQTPQLLLQEYQFQFQFKFQFQFLLMPP